MAPFWDTLALKGLDRLWMVTLGVSVVVTVAVSMAVVMSANSACYRQLPIEVAAFDDTEVHSTPV